MTERFLEDKTVPNEQKYGRQSEGEKNVETMQSKQRHNIRRKKNKLKEN